MGGWAMPVGWHAMRHHICCRRYLILLPLFAMDRPRFNPMAGKGTSQGCSGFITIDSFGFDFNWIA